MRNKREQRGGGSGKSKRRAVKLNVYQQDVAINIYLSYVHGEQIIKGRNII